MGHENRGRTAVKGVIKMSAGLSALKARTAKQFASRKSTVGRKSRSGSKFKKEMKNHMKPKKTRKSSKTMRVSANAEEELSKKGHKSTGSGTVIFENPFSMIPDADAEKSGTGLQPLQSKDGSFIVPENANKKTIKELRKHHRRESTQLPEGWGKRRTDDGMRYYYKTSDNPDLDTQWEQPEGSRMAAKLGKHQKRGTADGTRFYLDNVNLTSSWEAPEGSHGDGEIYSSDGDSDDEINDTANDTANGDFQAVEINLNVGQKSNKSIKRNRNKKGRRKRAHSREDRLATMKEMRSSTTQRRDSNTLMYSTEDQGSNKSPRSSVFSNVSSFFGRSNSRSSQNSDLNDEEKSYSNPLRNGMEDNYNKKDIKGMKNSKNQKGLMRSSTTQPKSSMMRSMFRKKGKKQVVDDTNALEMTDQTKKKTRLSTGSEGSHHSRDSTQMPSDWAKHLTEDGKSDRYYMNTETGETQWEPPEGSTGGAAAGPQLPKGWEKRKSDDGSVYYLDHNNATSHWELPADIMGAAAIYNNKSQEEQYENPLRNDGRKKDSIIKTEDKPKKKKGFYFPKLPSILMRHKNKAKRSAQKNAETKKEQARKESKKKKKKEIKKYQEEDELVEYDIQYYLDYDKWYYKDQDDMSQGPFHANDMRAWMDAGYISGDLNARLGHVGPYINLMELYADLSSAFTTIPDVTVVAVAIQPKKADTRRRSNNRKARSSSKPQNITSIKDLKKTRPVSKTSLGHQYENEGLTFLASVHFRNGSLSEAGDRATAALMKFFQLLDDDNGGSITVAEFTKAFRTIGNRLGGVFTHPGAYKLYTNIDVGRSMAVDKEAFVNGVLQLPEDDFDLCRILLAVDRVTNGALGGLFKEWRGQEFLQWKEDPSINRDGKGRKKKKNR